jgi:predicted KAP-like P-loop ATPase
MTEHDKEDLSKLHKGEILKMVIVQQLIEIIPQLIELLAS